MLNFEELLTKLKQDNTAKIVLLSVLAILLIILLYAAFYSDSKKAVLFANLSESDLPRITMALDANKIAYEVDLSSGSIYVSDSSVHDVRMMLMSDGVVLDSNVGFELFNNTEFGMTEFSQKINYQRALQGELSRTISSLREIRYARVHIVQAESRLFKSPEDTSSASITLFLNDNMRLNEAQIRGIQNIVASSVDKLQTDNVIVTDQSGIVLSSNTLEDTRSDIYKFSKRESLEKYYTEKVNEILTTSLKSSEFIASVNVELDYTRSVMRREDYANSESKTAVMRERTSTVQKTGATTKDIEYKVGSLVESTELEAGRIKRVTVGVLVIQKLPEEQLDKLKNVIQMAIGIKPERGDNIAIFSDKFNLGELRESQPYPVATEIHAGETGRNIADSESESTGIESFAAFFKRYNISTNAMLYGLATLILVLILLNIYQLVGSRRQAGMAAHVNKEKVLNEIRDWMKRESQNAK